MSQHSGKSLFFTLLVTGTLGYSSGAFAGCTPSVTSGYGSATCIGTNALYYNTTGLYNTSVGSYALFKNVSGSSNSAMGSQALYSNTTGYNNSAMGSDALYYNTTGSSNSSVGAGGLYYNTTGSSNSSVGSVALYKNTTGSSNSAMGSYALYSNTTGTSNIAMGWNALASNTTGSSNSAMGMNALSNNTKGTYNIAVGTGAGSNLTIGNNNIDIANWGVAGESGVIRIGSTGTQTKTYLAGVWGSTVNGSTVTVNNQGQLGVALSSRRYKEDIKPMGSVSDRLLELRPVTFHYKKPDEEGRKPIQYGLIAEEVDAVMPELVIRNKDGSPETVAYQYIPSLLLNEYQKQHKELVDTKAKMAEMQSQIDKLNAITKKLLAALPATTKTAMAK